MTARRRPTIVDACVAAACIAAVSRLPSDVVVAVTIAGVTNALAWWMVRTVLREPNGTFDRVAVIFYALVIGGLGVFGVASSLMRDAR